MASLTFRGGVQFCEEAITVTAAAALAGVLAPLVTGLPLEVAAPAAALFGGSIGAALSRPRPAGKGARALLGTIGGAMAALGFAALATRFGLGEAGAVIGGGLGGLALGSLLASDEEDRSKFHAAAGIAGAATLGAVGAAAAANIAAYGAAHASPQLFTSGFIAGLVGLWVAAGSGLRRIEHYQDPLIGRAEALLEIVRDPVRTRVGEALRSYIEILQATSDDEFDSYRSNDANAHARELLSALLDTADNFHHLQQDLVSPRLAGIEQKLADLSLRSQSCDDPVTLSHLTRAQQALRAQKAALDGLRIGKQRAEAAIDAQVALMDRLRLAVAQYQASDRERFMLEMNAVGDQVARLSDDLDSLTSAMAEAESFTDRRILADVESSGRRALDSLNEALEAHERGESLADPNAKTEIEAEIQREVDAELRTL